MNRGSVVARHASESHGYVVERSVLARLQAALEPGALATVLYGSHARSSAGPASDIDVLQLVTKSSRPLNSLDVNVTRYTPDALAEMACRGSLFVLHLRVDSIILDDPEHTFQTVIDSYRRPSSYAPLYDEIRTTASVLHAVSDTTDHLTSLHKVGTYLLRTAIYAKLADRDNPLFDVEAACLELGDQESLAALKQKRSACPTTENIRLLLACIERTVGPIPKNDWGSVEGLVIEKSVGTSFSAQLLATILAPTASGIDYAMLVPPML